MTELIILAIIIISGVSIAYLARQLRTADLNIARLKQAEKDKDTFLHELISASATVDTSTAANNIIQHLLSESCFKFRYVTLVTWLESRNRMIHLGTNVPREHIGVLLEHINDLYAKLEDTCGKRYADSTEFGYLEYPSAAERLVSAEYFIPLYFNNSPIGGLFVESDTSQSNELLDSDFFHLMTENLSLVLYNIILMKRVLEQASIDSLTQLYNRNYMLNYYNSLRSSHSEYALILLDIDYFKKCNDTYGHLAGDYVLKSVSAVLKRSARQDFDGVFRYGGEEFLIILRDAPDYLAERRAEEIRLKIQALKLEYSGQSLNVTASLGVYNADLTKSFEANLLRADKALYYSKQHGRNQVTTYSAACDKEDKL